MKLLLLLPLLLCCPGHAKKATKLRRKESHHVTGDKRHSLFQFDVADPKFIIMEKYGRHYRLTGGSTLATKRNKGDIEGSTTTLQDASNTENGTRVSNMTVDLDNQDKNLTLTVNSTGTDNSTAALLNNNSAASVIQDKSKTLDDAGSHTNSTTSTDTNLNSNVNETILKNTSSSNPDLVNATHGGNETASKSDITNTRDAVVDNAPLINRTVTLHPTEQEIKNESSLHTTTINFGKPSDHQDGLPHNREDNVSSTGNLTTLKVDVSHVDLTPGNHTDVVIPGLDGNVHQKTPINVVYGSNLGNAPKRSNAAGIPTKPKKHIVFNIDKPKIVINDIANKRRQVTHVNAAEPKHVAHVNKQDNKRAIHVEELFFKKRHVVETAGISKRNHVARLNLWERLNGSKIPCRHQFPLRYLC